jgi:pimeloyl-ACP methyl ester carboxylesterase
LPGYGDTPLPDSFDYSIEAQIEFVEQVLSVMHVSQPVLLVVHDVGGPMGLAWAHANVADVRAILVLNTTVFPDFHWFQIARTWGSASIVGKMRALFGMRAIGLSGGKLFKKIFWKQSPELEEVDIDRVVQSFALNEVAKASTLVQFREMLSPGFFGNFNAWLARITVSVPTHVLWGNHDPYLPDNFAFRFSHASVSVVPNGGHWLPLTRPELVAMAARQIASAFSGGAS